MTNIPNTFYRTSIKALILDEQKRFMLIRESNDLWELPGGGLDFGEQPDGCIRRELMEEMSLEVTYIASRPLYFLTALNINDVWKSAIIYETKVKDLNFIATDECLELRFFTAAEAQQVPLYPIVQEFVKVFDIAIIK